MSEDNNNTEQIKTKVQEGGNPMRQQSEVTPLSPEEFQEMQDWIAKVGDIPDSLMLVGTRSHNLFCDSYREAFRVNAAYVKHINQNTNFENAFHELNKAHTELISKHEAVRTENAELVRVIEVKNAAIDEQNVVIEELRNGLNAFREQQEIDKS